ncbi:MAG TPA: hypothetical protein PLD25_29235 [Chloroflexota bacterium]|nr:hypothetical protein [Chloroflexota bacterium]HUM68686.1 hypothetical protein [Chloroflexota bacterium]
MGFFKKLLGGSEKKTAGEYVDKTGIYFYFQCDNCGKRVRVRADKQHDLLNDDGGFVWHKTVVDSKCFRRMETVVYLDGHYHVTSYELTGGRFLTQAEYEAAEQAELVAKSQPPETDQTDTAV